jgi:hypothetical protein
MECLEGLWYSTVILECLFGEAELGGVGDALVVVVDVAEAVVLAVVLGEW